MFSQRAYRRTDSYRKKQRACSAAYVNQPHIKEARRLKQLGRINDETKSRRLHWHATKGRAKHRGIVFSITAEEFAAAYPIDGRCRYCGEALVRGTRHGPSVDKVRPEGGYVVGNIDIICRLCNAHKNNHPMEWFSLIAARMGEVDLSATVADPPAIGYAPHSPAYVPERTAPRW